MEMEERDEVPDNERGRPEPDASACRVKVLRGFEDEVREEGAVAGRLETGVMPDIGAVVIVINCRPLHSVTRPGQGSIWSWITVNSMHSRLLGLFLPDWPGPRRTDRRTTEIRRQEGRRPFGA
jgi:hypothetical protein